MFFSKGAKLVPLKEMPDALTVKGGEGGEGEAQVHARVRGAKRAWSACEPLAASPYPPPPSNPPPKGAPLQPRHGDFP